MLGWIKNKDEFFKKIDIFFCSSYIEPFGLVILEAMLNGVPVISTKCKGPMDIIEHMKNGILVNIDDKQEMVKAIRLLEKDKLSRHQMGGILNGSFLFFELAHHDLQKAPSQLQMYVLL